MEIFKIKSLIEAKQHWVKDGTQKFPCYVTLAGVNVLVDVININSQLVGTIIIVDLVLICGNTNPE